MSIRSRYKAFQSAFPNHPLSQSKWASLTHWVDANRLLSTLDLSIFPDTLTSLVWDNANAKTLVFCDSQTKLTYLSLCNTQIRKVIVPKYVKGIKELIIVGSPIVELDLGGSIKSIDVLDIEPSTARNNVKLPVGMKNLTSLRMVSRIGPVSLPKTAPSLTYLSIGINIGDSAIRISSAYTSLKHITAYGTFSSLLIAKNSLSMESLEIESSSKDFILPELPNLLEVALITATKKPLLIPASYSTLRVLRVEAPNSKKVTIPSSLPNLSNINLTTPLVKDTLIPKDTINLMGMRIVAQDIVIDPTLVNLGQLIILGTSVKIPQAKTLGNLVHLAVSKDTSVRARLPTDMPLLETLAVNPQRMRFGKINTPRLDWFLKNPKSY